MRSRMLPVAVVAALAVTACGTDTPTGDELHIVATTAIWGDVVRQIAGDDAVVDVLIPLGTDAHEYQATPRQVAALSEADLVVANGLGLEEGLHDVLQTAVADGANLIELAPQLDPIPLPDPANDGDDHGALDPHVWFDPSRVDRAAVLLASELVKLDDSVDWEARAAAYSKDLLQVADDMERSFERIPADDRKLVTNHESLGYLADRFGFEVVGVVISGGSTLGTPSSAELAALVGVIESERVQAIFAETSESDALAEAVASEVGFDVSVIPLYTESLGVPGSGAEDLTGMLLTDARLISGGLT